MALLEERLEHLWGGEILIIHHYKETFSFSIVESYKMFNIDIYYLKCNVLLALFKQRLGLFSAIYKSMFSKSIFISLKISSNEDNHLVSVFLRTSFCSSQWNNTWPARGIKRGVSLSHHLLWKPNKPKQLALKTANFDPFFSHFPFNPLLSCNVQKVYSLILCPWKSEKNYSQSWVNWRCSFSTGMAAQKTHSY